MPQPPQPDRDTSGSHASHSVDGDRRAEYWKRNIRLLGTLLLVWAFTSFGCAILWRDWLDQWTIPGTHFPVGFWFAQQGSMLSFVGLVFVYAWRMNRLDREFGVSEDQE